MSQPVTTEEDQPISSQQDNNQQQQQQQQSLNQQESQPHADVGPNMPQPTQQRSNTVNQIPTESELENQGNTEAQTNNLGFPVVPKGQQAQQQGFPINPNRPLQSAAPPQQQQQQAVSATTSQGVKAPKAKLDFTATDATIQGLLIQVGAMQHNKIQQIIQYYQEQQE
jgi:hypothetical protein